MYIDVHWSFILLLSQVIFSFKEPYTTLHLKGFEKGKQQKAMN